MKKKKLLLMFSGLLLIILIGVIIHMFEGTKKSQKLRSAADQILKREEQGKLANKDLNAANVAQDGIQELIEQGKYSDAKRLIQSYLELYPNGIAYVLLYADLLEKQEKWDDSAKVMLDFAYDNWKIANITTTEFLLYTRLKEAEGKFGGETKSRLSDFFVDVEEMAKNYQQLQNDLKKKDMKADGELLKELKEAGADNEEFFNAYMEYLIGNGKKEEAMEYLTAYEKRKEQDDLTLTYVIVDIR